MARFTFGSFDALTVPDNGTVSSTLHFYGVGSAKVTDVSVTLGNLVHGHLDDLDMLLYGPDGRNLVFMSDLGGASASPGGSPIVFSDDGTQVPADEAASDLSGAPNRPAAYGEIEGPAQFSPSLPSGALNHAAPSGTAGFASAFGGGPAAGDWTLHIADDSGQGMAGSLTGWNLTLDVATTWIEVVGDRAGPTDDIFIVTSTGIGTGSYQLNDLNGVGFEGISSVAFSGLAGNDTFWGSAGYDYADGGEGRDTIHTRGGDDVITVYSYEDVAGEVYDGGTGRDEIRVIGLQDRPFRADFRDDTLNSIEILTFTSNEFPDFGQIQLTASQVGPGIASNAVIRSSYNPLYGTQNTDNLSIDMGTATALDLTGWIFESPFPWQGAVSVFGDNDNETIRGSSIRDAVQGSGGSDLIYGYAGNDALDGGAGVDTMIGGLGDDVFFVDHINDQAWESVGQGTDEIRASASYTLAAGNSIEKLSAIAGAGAINLIGNELANTIIGNSAANILNGRGGIDRMEGGGGNDLYYVDHTGDAVIEGPGSNGSDQILASVGYTMAAGLTVEKLTTTDAAGTAAINLFGNELIQTIIGNRGANVLQGGGARDTITPGNDAAVDTIRFTGLSDSTSFRRDEIIGLDLNNEDKLDFPFIPNGPIGSVGGNLSAPSFDSDIAAAVNAFLGPRGAVLFDPTGGNLNTAGHTYLVIDANNDGNYTAGSDYVVQLVNATGTLDLTDFV